MLGFLHLSELTDEPAKTPDQLIDEGRLVMVKGAAGGADGTWRMGMLVPDRLS
ncbi:hypothetical protein AB0H82_10235 [Streptomyces sp. NPDC050732]|uniref:hypothetical protein n=1 Tax=Streptomyces sp. NPDC050732 TaxID=3154632 RepID=UPI00341D847E